MRKRSSGAGCSGRGKKFTPGNSRKLLKNGCKGEAPGRIHPELDRNAQIQPPRYPKEGGSAGIMSSRKAGLWMRNGEPGTPGVRHLASTFALRAMEDLCLDHTHEGFLVRSNSAEAGTRKHHILSVFVISWSISTSSPRRSSLDIRLRSPSYGATRPASTPMVLPVGVILSSWMDLVPGTSTDSEMSTARMPP